MNINQLMKQAQQMQKKMQEMQAEIANQEFEGKSGGGLVKVIMSGQGDMLKVDINPSLLQSSEKEMLEDLIVAAHSDAKNKANEASKTSMGSVFGNMGGLPGGMKLPF